MKLKLACLFVLLSLWLSVMPGAFTAVHAQALRLDVQLVTREIHYNTNEASEVALVWGINGWGLPPEALRPAGTTIIKLNNDAMRTPMIREGDTFVAKVQVPAGSRIDYIFQISKTRSGVATEAWDVGALAERQFHIAADQDGITVVDPTVQLAALLYTSPADMSVQRLSIYILLGLSFVLLIIMIRLRYRNPFLDF